MTNILGVMGLKYHMYILDQQLLDGPSRQLAELAYISSLLALCVNILINVCKDENIQAS